MKPARTRRRRRGEYLQRGLKLFEQGGEYPHSPLPLSLTAMAEFPSCPSPGGPFSASQISMPYRQGMLGLLVPPFYYMLHFPPQCPVPCMACAGPHGVGGRRSPRGHPARPVRRDGVGFRGNTLRSYAVRSLPPAGDVWGRQGHCPWILWPMGPPALGAAARGAVNLVPGFGLCWAAWCGGVSDMGACLPPGKSQAGGVEPSSSPVLSKA